MSDPKDKQQSHTELRVSKEQYDSVENAHRIGIRNGDDSKKMLFQQINEANTFVRNFVLMLATLAAGITGLWTVATRPITDQLKSNKEQQIADIARLEEMIHKHMTVSATDRWTARMEIFAHKLTDLFGRSLTAEEIQDIQTALYPGAPMPDSFLQSLSQNVEARKEGAPGT